MCAYRAVSAYVAAALDKDRDLPAGYLFAAGREDGTRDSLQGHFRAAGLPVHFTMHSFRVGGSLRRSIDGTSIEEVMQIWGWKAEAVSRDYIGPTTVASSVRGCWAKRKRTGSVWICLCRHSLSSTLPLADTSRVFYK